MVTRMLKVCRWYKNKFMHIILYYNPTKFWITLLYNVVKVSGYGSTIISYTYILNNYALHVTATSAFHVIGGMLCMSIANPSIGLCENVYTIHIYHSVYLRIKHCQNYYFRCNIIFYSYIMKIDGTLYNMLVSYCIK